MSVAHNTSKMWHWEMYCRGDIDLLARTENSVDVIVTVIQEICSQPVELDLQDAEIQ